MVDLVSLARVPILWLGAHQIANVGECELDLFAGLFRLKRERESGIGKHDFNQSALVVEVNQASGFWLDLDERFVLGERLQADELHRSDDRSKPGESSALDEKRYAREAQS